MGCPCQMPARLREQQQTGDRERVAARVDGAHTGNKASHTQRGVGCMPSGQRPTRKGFNSIFGGAVFKVHSELFPSTFAHIMASRLSSLQVFFQSEWISVSKSLTKLFMKWSIYSQSLKQHTRTTDLIQSCCSALRWRHSTKRHSVYNLVTCPFHSSQHLTFTCNSFSARKYPIIHLLKSILLIDMLIIFLIIIIYNLESIKLYSSSLS